MEIKRALAPLAAAAMIFSLAACGDDSGGGSKKKKSSSISSEAKTEASSAEEQAEKTTLPPATEPEPETEPPTEPPAKNFWDEYGGGSGASIKDGDAFHDGMAWVTMQGGDKLMTYAINKYGEVKFTIDSSDTEGIGDGTNSIMYHNSHTYFSRGCAIVSTDSKQLLIDSEGEVIWDADKDGMDYAVGRWGEDGVKGIVLGNETDGNTMYRDSALGNTLYDRYKAFDGYALVQFDIDSFDFTGHAYGFLKPDGTWLLEPFETGWNVTYEAGDCYCHYRAGDAYDSGEAYVNIETGEKIIGEVYPLPDKVKAWQRAYNCKAQDGLDFDVEKKAFVDAEGNVVIDCSQYKFTAEIYGNFKTDNYQYIPAFHDGYAVLAVLNDDNSPFFFAIDKKGDKQYEPKRFQDNFSFDESMSFYISEDVMTYGCFTKGARFWYTEGWGAGENGETKYLDHTGKEVAFDNLDIAFYAPFSEGVAAVSVYPGTNKNVIEVRYIDHDGNDIFPKH